jgi:murein DD-endopeptidase MepM/ murein hydrolase activator NlpD
MAILSRLAAVVICILLTASAAQARVKVPDYSHLNRKMESGKPGSPPSLSVKVDSVSRASLSHDRGKDSPYRELLSLLEDLPDMPDVVSVAERVGEDGVTAPVYVAVERDDREQSFWRFAPDDEPEGWFDERGRRLDAALGLPKPGSRISSPFGPRRYYGRLSGGGFHDGIDFESRVGEPVYAAADGVIEHQGGLFEYGLTVKIRHAAQFTTLYAHLSRFAHGLAVGSSVRKGQLIGFVGMTGRSTGAHLHFSAIANGRFIDPAPYLGNGGHRPLSAPALATFRQWQQEIRAAVEAARGREHRPRLDDVEWTTRT